MSKTRNKFSPEVRERALRRVLSVQCELVSTGRSGILKLPGSGHKRLPLDQGGRAAKL